MIALAIFGLFDSQNQTGSGFGGGLTLLFFGFMLAAGAWNMGGGTAKIRIRGYEHDISKHLGKIFSRLSAGGLQRWQ